MKSLRAMLGGAVLFAMMMYLNACGEDEQACLYHYTYPATHSYYCKHHTESLCEDMSTGSYVLATKYMEDSQCKDWGYTTDCGDDTWSAGDCTATGMQTPGTQVAN